MIGGYSAVVASQPTQNSAQTSIGSITSIIVPTALWTIPANYLYVGKLFRIKALVGITNVITQQYTFTFRCYIGAVIVWDSGALTTNTTAHAAIPAEFEIFLKVITTGVTTTATVIGHGRVTSRVFVRSGATADPVLTDSTFIIPGTTPAASTGFDSTIANILDFKALCSQSDSSNGVTTYSYSVEDLN